MEHRATVSKDNSGLFEGNNTMITPDHGRKLMQWLDKGIDVKGKEEEDRQEFIKMIEEACKLNEDALVKVNEIEHKMQKSINELPYNLVQLAWSRVEQVINQKAN
jgi:hypothetical protein